MKKNILLTGAVTLMMAACSNEEILTNEEEAVNNAEPTLTIIATQGDAESRLAFVDEKHLAWTPGDKIIVTDMTNVVTLTLQETEATKTGTFTTTDATTDVEKSCIANWKSAGTSLVAYYYADSETFATQSMANMLMFGWFYTGNACQKSDGNMEHLTTFNHMASKESFTLSNEDNTVVNQTFSQMGAIMKFTLTGLKDKTITKLTLGAEEDVFTDMLISISGQPQLTYVPSVSLSLGEDGAGITAGETLTAYMMMGPTELTAGKTMSLYATDSDGNIYSASVNGGKLEAGKFYSLSKEMESYTFFSEGDGSSETSPYMISSIDDLKNLHKYINLGYGEGEYFKLKNNIDLSSVCGESVGNWLPRIGGDGSSSAFPGFKGTFDGDGHTISGLYYSTSTTEEYVALFGCIAEGGTLKNLNVSGNITAYMYSAGVVARNYGTVSGCTFAGTVNVNNFGTGGVVGDNKGTVIGCSNNGTITATEGYAGGIVGYMDNGNIVACYNTGNIPFNGTNDNLGGIVGYINYAEDDVTIDACYHTSETPVVGSINESTVAVSNCYWKSSSASAVGSGSATITGGGSTTDLTMVVTTMNSAISSASAACDYIWAEKDGSLVLTKEASESGN